MLKKSLQGVLESVAGSEKSGSSSGVETPEELKKIAEKSKQEAEDLAKLAAKDEESAKKAEDEAEELEEKAEQAKKENNIDLAKNLEKEALKKKGDAQDFKNKAAKKEKEASKKHKEASNKFETAADEYAKKGDSTEALSLRKEAKGQDHAAEKEGEKAEKLKQESELAALVNKDEAAELNAEEVGFFEQKKGKVFEIKWGESHEIKGFYSNELKCGTNIDSALAADFKFDFGPSLKFSGCPIPIHGSEKLAPEASFHNSKELKFNFSEHGDDKYTKSSVVYAKDGFASYSGYDENLTGEAAVLAYEAYEKSIQRIAAGLWLVHLANNLLPIIAGLSTKDQTKEEIIKNLARGGAGVEAAFSFAGLYYLVQQKDSFRNHFVPKSVISNHEDHGVYLGAVSNGGAKPNGRQGSELYLNKEFRVQVSDNVEAYDIDRVNNSRQPRLNASISTRLVLNPNHFKASSKDSIELRLNDSQVAAEAAEFDLVQTRNELDKINADLSAASDRLTKSLQEKNSFFISEARQRDYVDKVHVPNVNEVNRLTAASVSKTAELSAKEIELNAARLRARNDLMGAFLSIYKNGSERQVLCQAERVRLVANNSVNDLDGPSNLCLTDQQFTVDMRGLDAGVCVSRYQAGIRRNNNQRLFMGDQETEITFDENNFISIQRNRIDFKLNGQTVSWSSACFNTLNELKVRG